MAKMLALDTPIQYVKGVGPRRRLAFERAGIRTVEDALFYLPFRYEDRSRFKPIAQVRPGERITLRGKVISCGATQTRVRRMMNFELVLDDGTGQISAIWFNQPFLDNTFKAEQEVILHGVVKVRYYGRSGGLRLEGPEHEIISAEAEKDPVHMGGVVPIYERIENLGPKALRTIMHNLVGELPEKLPDIIPASVAREAGLIGRADAFREAHFPQEFLNLFALNSFATPAHKRLVFEEFFALQCGLLMRKTAVEESPGIAFKTSPELREILKNILPFKLTSAQRRVFKEIVNDMISAKPMHRLLHGDVGCGKTIVALLAMIIAAENGYQCALMAPTEVLAEQHFFNIKNLLKNTPYKVVLLTGAKSKKRKKLALSALSYGDAHIAVGTHALLEDPVKFQNLGFVVIDEQHRFGVLQRTTLVKKAVAPDVLVMTATPIPRSLALTVYGDLDVSVIDELPPGRTPVETRIVSERERNAVYNILRHDIASGGQAYVIYPLIEDSPKLADLKAATQMAEHLKRDVFPEFSVSLLHGRMQSEEKEKIMADFKLGKTQILVSTTVIEVGVDVANASIMLIENAERFGLAQLHQLRGRVGRGERKSRCFLLTGGRLTEEARRRLDITEETNDGFKIAEVDLDIRGPGEFFGTAQSGQLAVRVGNIVRDRKTMEEARHYAEKFLAQLKEKTPSEKTSALEFVKKRWGKNLRYASAG